MPVNLLGNWLIVCHFGFDRHAFSPICGHSLPIHKQPIGYDEQLTLK